MRSLSVGLGAKNLKDKDFFTHSDPFCVISRPNISGGFFQVRVSETVKNTLNPEWSNFLIPEAEIPLADVNLKLKFEVYDDDGKKGFDNKDKLLGVGFFSLSELESAYTAKSGLPLMDGKQKSAGVLLVRSFKIHGRGSEQLSSSSYQQGQSVTTGYPTSGYPALQPSQGYPPYPSGGYPGQQQPSVYPGYPAQSQAAPPRYPVQPMAGGLVYPGGQQDTPYPAQPPVAAAGFFRPDYPGSGYPGANLPPGPGYQ